MDLSSRKIESISRIGLPNPKRTQFFFGGGICILTFLGMEQGGGEVPKKRPKNVSREKSICKSSLIS